MIDTFIFDTGAILLYFSNHAESKEYYGKVDANHCSGLVPQLVFIEFYYLTAREFGKETARIRLTSLQNSKLKPFLLDATHYIRVGNLKISNRDLSLVDATVVLTGLLTKGLVLTTDKAIAEIGGLRTEKLLY